MATAVPAAVSSSSSATSWYDNENIMVGILGVLAAYDRYGAARVNHQWRRWSRHHRVWHHLDLSAFPLTWMNASRLTGVIDTFKTPLQCETISIPPASRWSLAELADISRVCSPSLASLRRLNLIQPSLATSDVTPSSLRTWLRGGGDAADEKSSSPCQLQHLAVDASFAALDGFDTLVASLTSLTSLVIDKSNGGLPERAAHACLDAMVRHKLPIRRLVLPGLRIDSSLPTKLPPSFAAQIHELDITGSTRDTRDAVTQLAAALPFILPSFINIRSLTLPGLPTLPAVVVTALSKALAGLHHLTDLVVSSPLEFTLPSLPRLLTLTIRGDCTWSYLGDMPLLESFECGELNLPEASSTMGGGGLLSLVAARYPRLRRLLPEGIAPAVSSSILTLTDAMIADESKLPRLPDLHTFNLAATTPVNASWFMTLIRCIPNISTWYCSVIFTRNTSPSAMIHLPFTMCHRLIKFNVFVAVDGDDEILDNTALAITTDVGSDSKASDAKVVTVSSLESLSIDVLMGASLSVANSNGIIDAIFTNRSFPSLSMLQISGDFPLSSTQFGTVIRGTPHVHHIRVTLGADQTLSSMVTAIAGVPSIGRSLHALMITQHPTADINHDLKTTRSYMNIAEIGMTCRNLRVLSITRAGMPMDMASPSPSIPSVCDDITLQAFVTGVPDLWHITLDHIMASVTGVTTSLLRHLPHLMGLSLPYWRLPPTGGNSNTQPLLQFIGARRVALASSSPSSQLFEMELTVEGADHVTDDITEEIAQQLQSAAINLQGFAG